jgi:branched-chain amino acid transport system ATP-binding protein
MPPVINIKSLNKSFGGIVVADDINFEIHQGEVLGLIGPNGAGKTSLFNLIGGLIKADYGSISISGVRADQLPIYKRARLGIARTWQTIRLFHSLNLVDNLLISTQSYAGETFSGLLASQRDIKHLEELSRDRAISLLDRVGLKKRSFALPSELSYGQQKLLGLARALMNDGACLLLDEPMAGVERRTYDKIKEIIQEELENEKAIIVVEHNIGFIRDICNKAFFMFNGKIIAQGSVDYLTSDKRLTEIYFGG